MATTVDEIMNRELFSVGPSEPAEQVLQHILTLGITGAPVVDLEGRPIGMVSFRDLIDHTRGPLARDRMTSPPVVVQAGARIAEAGQLMGETGYHRLVVVDGKGKAVGLVSALDVVRGLVGLPAAHPSAFPHYDNKTGVTWTDDVVLAIEKVGAAPDAAGVLLLIHGGAYVPETVVWGETATNVRTRLYDMLSTPQTNRLLAYWIERGNLRFRAAAVPNPAERRRTLEEALRRTEKRNGR